MKTILVSKDINLRMKARSLGLLAEDYITDKVTNIDIFEQGKWYLMELTPNLSIEFMRILLELISMNLIFRRR